MRTGIEGKVLYNLNRKTNNAKITSMLHNNHNHNNHNHNNAKITLHHIKMTKIHVLGTNLRCIT